jgi:hypothetical protein
MMKKLFWGRIRIFRNFPQDRPSLMASKFREVGIYFFGVKISISK